MPILRTMNQKDVLGSILQILIGNRTSLENSLATLTDRIEELDGGYHNLIGKPSGGDFTTSYTSAITITCAGLPAWHPNLISEDIEKIVQINNVGVVVTTYLRDEVTITIALNVITVLEALFTATDTFIVYTNIRSSESDLSAILTALQALTGALKSVDTDELITRLVNPAGTEISPATETTLALLNGKVTTCDTSNVSITALPNEGQQTMANSISVTIASNQSTLPVSVTNIDVLLSTRASEATLASLDGKVTICNTGAVVISSGTITTVQTAYVQGNVAHDGIDSGNPIKTGGKAVTSEPIAVANNDRVDSYFDEYGRQHVVIPGLLNRDADYIALTYIVGGLADGEISTATFKKGGAGGSTVMTLTLTYNVGTGYLETVTKV